VCFHLYLHRSNLYPLHMYMEAGEVAYPSMSAVRSWLSGRWLAEYRMLTMVSTPKLSWEAKGGAASGDRTAKVYLYGSLRPGRPRHGLFSPPREHQRLHHAAPPLTSPG
jgi:hypothetical protein